MIVDGREREYDEDGSVSDATTLGTQKDSDVDGMLASEQAEVDLENVDE